MWESVRICGGGIKEKVLEGFLKSDRGQNELLQFVFDFLAVRKIADKLV